MNPITLSPALTRIVLVDVSAVDPEVVDEHLLGRGLAGREPDCQGNQIVAVAIREVGDRADKGRIITADLGASLDSRVLTGDENVVSPVGGFGGAQRADCAGVVDRRDEDVISIRETRQDILENRAALLEGTLAVDPDYLVVGQLR